VKRLFNDSQCRTARGARNIEKPDDGEIKNMKRVRSTTLLNGSKTARNFYPKHTLTHERDGTDLKQAPENEFPEDHKVIMNRFTQRHYGPPFLKNEMIKNGDLTLSKKINLRARKTIDESTSVSGFKIGSKHI
jgi:hypothetical protein